MSVGLKRSPIADLELEHLGVRPHRGPRIGGEQPVCCLSGRSVPPRSVYRCRSACLHPRDTAETMDHPPTARPSAYRPQRPERPCRRARRRPRLPKGVAKIWMVYAPRWCPMRPNQARQEIRHAHIQPSRERQGCENRAETCRPGPTRTSARSWRHRRPRRPPRPQPGTRTQVRRLAAGWLAGTRLRPPVRRPWFNAETLIVRGSPTPAPFRGPSPE